MKGDDYLHYGSKKKKKLEAGYHNGICIKRDFFRHILLFKY